MTLLTIEEYRDNFKTPPDPRTIKSWCETGAIAAKKIGKHWFVIEEAEVKAKPKSKVDSLVNKVMNGK